MLEAVADRKFDIDNYPGVEEIDGGYCAVVVSNSLSGGVQRLKFVSSAEQRDLTRLVAVYAHQAVSAMQSKQSRESFARSLTPFLKYIATNSGGRSTRGVSGLSADVVASFGRWMRTGERGLSGRGVRETTVRRRLSALIGFLKWCDGNGHDVADKSFASLKPWLRHREGKAVATPREAYSEEEFLTLRRACRTEIASTIAGFALAEAVRNNDTIVVPPPNAGSGAYRDIAVGLKTMMTMYPGSLREEQRGIAKRRPGFEVHLGITTRFLIFRTRFIRRRGSLYRSSSLWHSRLPSTRRRYTHSIFRTLTTII